MDPTRRGFLSGLLGLTVIAVLPKPLAIAVPRPLNPYDIAAPEGLTYQWVRCALLGIPDPENVQKRIDNGWQFVAADKHPNAPTATIGETIDRGGLVLMWKSTADVQAQFRAEKEAARLAQAELLGVSPEIMDRWSTKPGSDAWKQAQIGPKPGDPGIIIIHEHPQAEEFTA